MTVFVYEYFTARGIGREPGSPEHGIYREGRAMRDAVVEDFRRIPEVDVVVFPDLPAWGESNWAVVIAPEFDGILADAALRIGSQGGDLLGPTLEAIWLTSDKLLLAEHWRAHGVPTPATTDRQPTACEAFPVVWKPRF